MLDIIKNLKFVESQKNGNSSARSEAAKIRVPWSEAELATLDEVYPNQPIEVIKATFPNRTWNSIKTHANMRGLRLHQDYTPRTYGERWTVAEEESFRNDYPNMSREELLTKYAPKTWLAISQKACYMGITREFNMRRFTEDENKLIRQIHQLGRKRIMTALPGVEWTRIRQRAQSMGIKFNGPLTEYDQQLMRDLIKEGCTFEQIAEAVHLDLRQVGVILRKLKLIA